MEKYEGLKLVGENGEIVLMFKDEYLKLAEKKGWDTKIPQLDDGTYDCDVFGDDDVYFDFGFAITGTLYLKDNAKLDDDIFANEGIIFGDGADTYGLSSANGDVIVGNDADTCEITGRNVICGDKLSTNHYNISATDGDVILGKEADIHDPDEDDPECNGYVSANEDIICDDEPTA